MTFIILFLFFSFLTLLLFLFAHYFYDVLLFVCHFNIFSFVNLLDYWSLSYNSAFCIRCISVPATRRRTISTIYFRSCLHFSNLFFLCESICSVNSLKSAKVSLSSISLLYSSVSFTCLILSINLLFSLIFSYS